MQVWLCSLGQRKLDVHIIREQCVSKVVWKVFTWISGKQLGKVSHV